MDGSPATARTARAVDLQLDALRDEVRQLAARTRRLEKFIDTYADTHPLKRLLFIIQGWPAFGLASERGGLREHGGVWPKRRPWDNITLSRDEAGWSMRVKRRRRTREGS